MRFSARLRRPLGLLCLALWLCAAYAAGGIYAQLAQGSVVGGKHAIIRSHGFDSGEFPSEEGMKYLQEHNNFSYFGIYIGGQNGPSRLPSRSYFQTVHTSNGGKPAWSFLPLWVGPQPRCTNEPQHVSQYMSEEASQVQSEARIEANHAIARAEVQGFGPGAVIYYDLEGFDSSKTNCNERAEQFIDIWAKFLASEGWGSGMYGSSNSSHDVEFWSNEDRVDDMWFGQTNGVGEQSVYQLQGVPEEDWKVHRFHQYIGEQQFESGPVSQKIDRDCAYGMADGSNETVESECIAH